MGWPEIQNAIERLADAMTKDQREQRRYEIARDVFTAMAGAECWNLGWGEAAGASVRAADALLAELERTDGVS